MNFTKLDNIYKNQSVISTDGIITPEDFSHRELVEKLRLANQLVEEYQRLKTNFIANISHEMRTPLNAILGFAELSEMEDISLEEMKDYMKIIRKSSEQLLETIKDILYIATLDSAEMNLQHDPVSPKGIFQTIEEYYQYFEDKGIRPGIELKFKTPEDHDFTFICDAEKLNLILRKLVDNGLRFTNQGYVEARCTGFDGTFVNFYVNDTGIGIPEDKIKLIFEPFRTVDESHNRQYSGSGLGLAIVERLVKLMGGEINIDSKPGVGTTVRFSIKPFDNL